MSSSSASSITNKFETLDVGKESKMPATTRSMTKSARGPTTTRTGHKGSGIAPSISQSVQRSANDQSDSEDPDDIGDDSEDSDDSDNGHNGNQRSQRNRFFWEVAALFEPNGLTTMELRPALEGMQREENYPRTTLVFLKFGKVFADRVSDSQVRELLQNFPQHHRAEIFVMNLQNRLRKINNQWRAHLQKADQGIDTVGTINSLAELSEAVGFLINNYTNRAVDFVAIILASLEIIIDQDKAISHGSTRPPYVDAVEHRSLFRCLISENGQHRRFIQVLMQLPKPVVRVQATNFHQRIQALESRFPEIEQEVEAHNERRRFQQFKGALVRVYNAALNEPRRA